MTTVAPGANARRLGTPPSRLARFVRGPWVFILPGVLLYSLFSLYPILYQFYVAMTDMEIATIYSPNWVGLANFRFIATDPIFREVFRFTLLFTLVTVPTQFVLGFGLALLLDQRLHGRVFFRTAIILPMAISALIVGLMWRLLLQGSTVGLVNALLDRAHLPIIEWFSNTGTARFAVFLVNIWQSVGGTMVFMLGGLQTIPVEVTEAARVDGANAWQQVTRIKLPMLRLQAGLALIYIFLGAFQIFEKVLALTKGGPGGATATIGYRMYITAFGEFGASMQGFLGRASAMGVVMFLFVLACSLVYLRLMVFNRQED